MTQNKSKILVDSQEEVSSELTESYTLWISKRDLVRGRVGGVCESGWEQDWGGGGGASLSSGQKAVEKLRVGPERSHHQ